MTVTLTGPAVSGGAVATILDFEVTVTLVASTEPNSTPVTPLRLVPVITTLVPPPPDAGETVDTEG